MSQDHTHTRREFLVRAAGAAGIAALVTGAGASIAGCKSTPTGPTDTPLGPGLTLNGNTLTIDTTNSNYSLLAKLGGYAEIDASNRNLVVFRTGATTAVALSRICTHEGCDMMDAKSGMYIGDRIVCSCHGSTFMIDSGAVIKGPAASGLQKFPAVVSGTNVVVTLA
jgi:cytochrome b6-f complex iron-sulfur subunit